MSFKIVVYGNPVLREKATPITEVTDETRQLADEMLETMYAARGLGLAAEQVGHKEAICVIDVPPLERDDGTKVNENPDVQMPLVLINPEITQLSGTQDGQEGCLSFPEIFANVKRAECVTVNFLDRNGNPQTVTAKGLLSRAIQHELDHLNGVLLVDRMSAVKRVAVKGRLKRLKNSATTE